MKIERPMNRKKTMELLLTFACLAGGLEETTSQEMPKPETLEVRSGSH